MNSVPNSANELLQICVQKKLRVTTAESCTGGLLGAILTKISGSSKVYDRGFITYSNAAKQDMLGVETRTLAQFGAVSEQVADEMVRGACKNSNAELAISITGIAGPGPSDHKPEGRVCFGLATAHDLHISTFVHTIEFGAIGRENVRQKAADHAIKLLLDAAQKY